MSPLSDRIYNVFMYPLEKIRLNKQRHLLLEDVAGHVLEVGFGTGANFTALHFEQLDSYTIMDEKLPKFLSLKPFPKTLNVKVVKGDVQALPFEDGTFDSIVFTLVFCTVSDPHLGLSEIFRVTKPGGRIYFMEHVLPTKHPYKEIFRKATPFWKRVAHNCHLDRDTVTYISQAGFKLLDYHRFFRTSFVVGIAEKEV